jgi:hypothetical protein
MMNDITLLSHQNMQIRMATVNFIFKNQNHFQRYIKVFNLTPPGMTHFRSYRSNSFNFEQLTLLSAVHSACLSSAAAISCDWNSLFIPPVG